MAVESQSGVKLKKTLTRRLLQTRVDVDQLDDQATTALP